MMLYIGCFRCLPRRSSFRPLETAAVLRRWLHYVTPAPEHPPAEAGILKSRHDWLVLHNYAKHLSTDHSEITRDKCISMLISLSQLVLEQNYSKGFLSSASSAFICSNGAISSTPVRKAAPGGFVLEPQSLVSYLKYMANIRPYYRLKHQWINKRASNPPSLQLPPPQHVAKLRSDYSEVFASLIGSGTRNAFRPVNRKVGENHIGPLRMASDHLVTIPQILTRPFYFEVSLEMQPCEPSIDQMKVVDKCVESLFDHLLYYFQGDDAALHLCLTSMFMATILYGPKLRLDDDSAITAAFREFHKSVTKQALACPDRLSFRSLAYLLNSSFYPADMKELCDLAADRVINSKDAIPLEYLENICFTLSRVYYANDAFYERISQIIVAQSDEITPTVCLNLLWSFCRLNKIALVVEPLEGRLRAFQHVHFEGLNPSFLKNACATLKGHVSAGALRVLESHISGALCQPFE